MDKNVSPDIRKKLLLFKKRNVEKAPCYKPNSLMVMQEESYKENLGNIIKDDDFKIDCQKSYPIDYTSIAKHDIQDINKYLLQGKG